MSLAKAVIALIMKTYIGSLSFLYGNMLPVFAERAITGKRCPTNKAPLSELSSEHPTELQANLPHN